VDVLNSISRVMIDVVTEDHRKKAGELLNIMSVYRKAEDMINIGAYAKGSNREIDRSIEMIERINTFLRQDIEAKITFQDSVQELDTLLRS